MKKRHAIAVHVTQEDIDRGQRNRACLCPIALAVARALGVPCSYVFINAEESCVYDDEPFRRSSRPRELFLSAEASQFVDDFDGYGQERVHPFTFRAVVEVP